MGKIDDFTKVLEPEMERHIQRWGYPESKNEWSQNIEYMRDFARLRPCAVRNQLIEYFEIEDSFFALHACDTIPTISGESNVMIYPNPNDGTMILQLSDIAISQLAIISVYSSTGVLHREEEIIIHEGKTSIPFSYRELAAGYYIFSINIDNELRKIPVIFKE